MERIKNALAEVPRASVSTVHYLYLARIPFLGWVTLFALPSLAITVGRPLVLAAYDLASSGEAFFVGRGRGRRREGLLNRALRLQRPVDHDRQC